MRTVARSALVRMVSALARKVSALARMVSALARKVSALARMVSALAQKVSALARKVSVLSHVALRPHSSSACARPSLRIRIPSIYKYKNEVGCRDDTVPKTVGTRRHCEEE